MARYEGEGQIIKVTLGGTVAEGDIDEIGDKTIALALNEGVSGDVIPYAISGRWTGVPKVAGTAWGQGDVLDWDASATAFQKDATLATGDKGNCAIAAEAAGSADTTGTIIMFNGGEAVT